MIILRQQNYSFISRWADKRLKKLEAEHQEHNDWKVKHRSSKNSPDENRIIRELIKENKSRGIKIIPHDNPKSGGGFCPSKDLIPQDKLEKCLSLELDKLQPGKPFISIPRKNTKLDVLAHETAHSKGGNYYWKTKLRGTRVGILAEETRANIKGLREIKKHNPKPETIQEAKKGLEICEKDYYNKLIRKPILEKLKGL